MYSHGIRMLSKKRRHFAKSVCKAGRFFTAENVRTHEYKSIVAGGLKSLEDGIEKADQYVRQYGHLKRAAGLH